MWNTGEPRGESKSYTSPTLKADIEIVRNLFAMKDTCTLDVADRDGATLEEVGNTWGSPASGRGRWSSRRSRRLGALGSFLMEEMQP